MNNDFLVTREMICQWFSLSLVKIIGKSPHSWPKIVIHGYSCIILYIFIMGLLIPRNTVFMRWDPKDLWHHHSKTGHRMPPSTCRVISNETNMKNQSEISWQFPAHPPPQPLRNYNKQAKRISVQLAQARITWAKTPRNVTHRSCANNNHILFLTYWMVRCPKKAKKLNHSLTSWSVPSHYLNQCWIIVNWTPMIFESGFLTFSFNKMQFQMATKCWLFCPASMSYRCKPDPPLTIWILVVHISGVIHVKRSHGDDVAVILSISTESLHQVWQ